MPGALRQVHSERTIAVEQQNRGTPRGPLLFPLPIHVLHTAMIAFGGFRFAVAEFKIAEHGAAGA